MAHAVHTRDLGRSRSSTIALIRSLTQALIRFERITTTLAKAKEAQRLAERLITLGKKGSLSNRRRAISLLGDSRAIARLFNEIAPRFSRSGKSTCAYPSSFTYGWSTTNQPKNVSEKDYT